MGFLFFRCFDMKFSREIIFICCFASILCLGLAADSYNHFNGSAYLYIDCPHSWNRLFDCNFTFCPFGITGPDFISSSYSGFPFPVVVHVRKPLRRRRVCLQYSPLTTKDFSVKSSLFPGNTASVRLLPIFRASNGITIRSEDTQYPPSESPDFVCIMKEDSINAKCSDLDIRVFEFDSCGRLRLFDYSSVRREPRVLLERNKDYRILWFAIGGTAVVGFCLFCLKFVNCHSNGTVNSVRINIPARGGRRFTFTEINAATNSFDESRVIGNGGFGKVYTGELEDGTMVAVKRASSQSEQGLTEFKREIEVLPRLLHRNLVSLVGYCEDQNEMILVYEYMANGNLRRHLFGSDLPPLSWKKRLEICIGAARGLHYLHTGLERAIIHRDVKATNILLNENFIAKIDGFGSSRSVPAVNDNHVSTNANGSLGYIDPEYCRNQQLTNKSDVYSFGVVLVEVMSARPVINPSLPQDQTNLAQWALYWQQRGMLEQIIDLHLEGAYSPGSLRKFGEIVEKCLADDGSNRPTIGDVLRDLENALRLQEEAVRGVSLNNSSSQLANIALNLPRIRESDERDESTLLQDQVQQTRERQTGERMKIV